MDLAETITVLVAGELPGRMTDRTMAVPPLGQSSINVIGAVAGQVGHEQPVRRGEKINQPMSEETLGREAVGQHDKFAGASLPVAEEPLAGLDDRLPRREGPSARPAPRLSLPLSIGVAA